MTPSVREPCTNCNTPIDANGAKGLCARCYQYRRRNGYLPPAELIERETGDPFMLLLPAELRKKIERAAGKERVSLAEWIRSACRKVLGVKS